jgi:hypothetical protein
VTAAPGLDPTEAELRLSADLTFSVSVDGRQMSGTLTGDGSDLHLRVSDPYLLGGSGTEPARALARELAVRGIRLRVSADRPLVTLGEGRSSFLQRRVTGSPHIRVASLAAALRLVRLRRARPAKTPLVPPATPLPLLPTLLRRPRQPRLTHDPDGGGYPRLVMAPSPHPRADERQPEFLLTDRTTIGSDPSCDVVLPSLDPLHAEVRRCEGDEFVLLPLCSGSAVRVHGAVVHTEALLRTGTRMQLGPWTLTYLREEYADHGRPYGGRIGGELGRQRPQPPWQDVAGRP